MLPPPAENYYAVLGVDPGADEELLRRAWRQQAATWHPDRAGEEATARFQQISAAYTILSDPIARAIYDRRHGIDRRAKPTQPSATTNSVPPRSTRPPTPALMLKRFTGQLSWLVTSGAAQVEDDGIITLRLRDDEAAQGGMAMITLHVEVWCPTCGGRPSASSCTRCGGRGVIEELFSAWLAIPPGVKTGETLSPSAELPGTVEPVRFRVALRPPA